MTTSTTDIGPDDASGSASSIENAVRRMAESVATSSALDNEFYQRWVAAPLSYPEVEVFAGEYPARAADLDVVHRAFDEFVNLTARYWLGVAEQMHRVR